MNIYAISNSQGHSYSMLDINKKLKDLGIPSDVVAKGQSAIQEYAFKNKIVLPASDKQEIQAEPAEVNGSEGKNKEEFEATLEALGIPKDTVEQGKDLVIKYAAQNNINIPDFGKNGTQFNSVA